MICIFVNVNKSNPMKFTPIISFALSLFVISCGSDAYKAASRAMAEVYGIEPVPSRGGGSITVIADAQKELKATPVLMGFGLERDLIHSPNESFLLDQWRKGMESIALFYKYF